MTYETDGLLATTLKAYRRPLAERYFGKDIADTMTDGELDEFIRNHALDLAEERRRRELAIKIGEAVLDILERKP